MIRNRQFFVPGIYLSDISKFTGASVSRLRTICKRLGIELLELQSRRHSPLSVEQAYQVLRELRSEEGSKWLRDISKTSNPVKKGLASR